MAVKTLTTRKPAAGLTSTFNDFFEPWSEWLQDGFASKQLMSPKVNITDDKTGYCLELAAPGLHKKDFKVDINSNLLTISAQQEENKEENEGKYSRREYNYSSFSRSFTLPKDVQQNKIEASYADGILKLNLPKNGKDTKENHKKIAVK